MAATQQSHPGKVSTVIASHPLVPSLSLWLPHSKGLQAGAHRNGRAITPSHLSSSLTIHGGCSCPWTVPGLSPRVAVSLDGHLSGLAGGHDLPWLPDNSEVAGHGWPGGFPYATAQEHRRSHHTPSNLVSFSRARKLEERGQCHSSTARSDICDWLPYTDRVLRRARTCARLCFLARRVASDCSSSSYVLSTEPVLPDVRGGSVGR